MPSSRVYRQLAHSTNAFLGLILCVMDSCMLAGKAHDVVHNAARGVIVSRANCCIQFSDTELFLDPLPFRPLWWNHETMEGRRDLLLIANRQYCKPKAWCGQEVSPSVGHEHSNCHWEQGEACHGYFAGRQPLSRGRHVSVPSRKETHPSCWRLSLEQGFHAAAFAVEIYCFVPEPAG